MSTSTSNKTDTFRQALSALDTEYQAAAEALGRQCHRESGARFDALSYLYLSRVMDYFDPFKCEGPLDFSCDKALELVGANPVSFLVLSFDTDWRFSTGHSLRIVKHLDDFKSCRLLALDPIRVHRVNQVHWVVGGKLASDIETIVEVSLHLKKFGIVSDRLAQLAHRNFAFRNENCSGNARMGRICRC